MHKLKYIEKGRLDENLMSSIHGGAWVTCERLTNCDGQVFNKNHCQNYEQCENEQNKNSCSSYHYAHYSHPSGFDGGKVLHQL